MANQKWEHKIMTLRGRGIFEKIEAEFEDATDWELVSVLPRDPEPTPSVWLFFKRPKRSADAAE